MSPRDPISAVSSRKPTDIYSVMLILAAVFLLGAIALTWIELSYHYDFMGTETAGGVSTEAAEKPAGAAGESAE